MRFYRYWDSGTADVHTPRGATWTLRCYGGSNKSVADAAEIARGIASRAAAAIGRGEPVGYGYTDRPLREEIIETVPAADDSNAAVITRNGYGALVLNTAKVLFADVDYPDPSLTPPALGTLVGRLFGRQRPPDRDETILRRFQDAAEADRRLGIRVYRTANGYRGLVTTRTYVPTADDTHELLERLGSDELYRKLCGVQECFRASLTAKCWRCDVPTPPCRFPFADADRERRYRDWEEQYHATADGYAACAYVTTFGSGTVHDDAAPIVDMHDRLACAEGAELA